MSDLPSKLDRDDSIGTHLFQVKPRVMVVDDEPTNIRVLSEALKSDYDIIVATSAEQALRLLDKGERPHLLLLDIMMPDMDGLEMCRRLKQRQELQHIPVIFITALMDTGSEEKGFEAGAVDFIRKPINIPSVRARVRTHISLKGMLDHMVELNQTLSERLHQMDQLNWRLMQEQKQKKDRAAASKNLYEQAFMSTSEGIAVLDREGKITAVNPSYSRITGYSEAEALGRYHEILDMRVDKRQDSTSILDYLGVHNHWSGEIYNRRRNGEVYPELRTISIIRADDGQVTHYVTVFNDITNLKETEQRLEELTWRDPVTGFPNRALFLDQLSTVLKLCHHGGMATAVIVIDINNFRYINETYGFDCGDIVIQTFAERLRNACHEDDSIARLSGDEFGIVLAPKQWTLDEAYRIALRLFERIQEALREPVPYRSEGALTIEATGGIALYPTESSDMPSLALRHAETAHRNAKESHRAVAVFEDSMSENIRRQMAVESELTRAITENEIAMYAQPQLSPDRELAGIELLVRWNHPERGLLGPGEFIPFAERTRQIVALERHIVRECLGMLADMKADSRQLRCSINISAKHMAEEDFAETILRLVADSGYPPALITFELTESVMVKDVDAVVEKMETIRSLGCTFSLDDFGTGYSSLSQLRRLPISEIKIDRSFVLSALSDSTSADIVDMVKRIGESMNVRVVAEGVETQEHADFLKAFHPGVYLQGYFFGRPAPLWTFFEEQSS
ncbi:GGDEF/EAL domain-containing response regulator [Marinobacter algicola]|uniref:Sensory box protein n=1 Tax=Marinobacter algicola DG893 TaxID=443152 RepID=A6EZ00_9GAMM|nr:GGDEF domain-containing response regulator [Marinobacter algicola]EDM48240.1 sensory box protein [Marinobacter algicola DG893]